MASPPPIWAAALKEQPASTRPIWADALAEPTPQMQGNLRIPAMIGSNLATGAAGTVGLPGDVLQSQGFSNPILNIPQMALSGATRWVLDRFGIPQEKVPMVPGEPPTGAQVRAPLQRAGIVDRPDLQAQNETEKLIEAGSQGAGAALPLAFFGGPLAAARTILGGVGSGVGSYEGEKVAGKPGSIVGGLVGGVGTDLATGLAGKTAAVLAGDKTPVTGAFDRLAMKPRMVGDVTGTPSLQYAQKFAAKMPGGVGVTERAAQATLDEFGKAVETSAAKFGPHSTPQQAGETLQSHARDWIENKLPAITNTVWAPVDAAVGPTTATALTRYRAALEQIVKAHPDMPATSGAVTPSGARKLLDALNADVPAGGTASWSTVQGIRSHIGDMLGTPEFVDTIGSKNLSRIYGALTEDMRATADTVGARPYFDQANRVSTAAYAFRDNVLSRFVKARNPALETIAPDKAALTALGSNHLLQQVRDELPGAADALAAYELRRLGIRPGTGGATAETISPAAFLSELNKRRMARAEGTKALYGPGNQDLADLSTVAQTGKSAEKFVNTSGTAGHAAAANMANALGVATGAAIGGGATREVLPALAAAAAVPAAGWSLAKTLTSPTVARFAATPSRIPRALPLGSIPLTYLLGR